jgi:uncharacterized cupin superfamily protein
MHRTTIEDGAVLPSRATVKRSLSQPLGTTELAINYYELESGEEFSNALHTHLDQEEVFYVVAGTATFETDDGQVRVGEGEAIRFGPGEYQYGYNDGTDRVTALAIGGPRDSTEFRFECPHCESRMRPHRRVADDGDRVVYHCRHCERKISEMS